MPYAAGQTGATSTGSKSRYSADGSRSAAFAMMADMNPLLDEKLENGSATQDNWEERAALIPGTNGGDWEDLENWQIQRANAQAHGREGQNVTFGDGHASFEKRGDAGVKYDYIYTRWIGTGADEISRRKGLLPSTATTDLAPAGNSDSVLVNDPVDMTIL